MTSLGLSGQCHATTKCRMDLPSTTCPLRFQLAWCYASPPALGPNAAISEAIAAKVSSKDVDPASAT
eukprot:1206970-Amphidinium_carterae.1